MAVFAVFAIPWVRAEPVITAVITVGRANGSSSAGHTATHALPSQLQRAQHMHGTRPGSRVGRVYYPNLSNPTLAYPTLPLLSGWVPGALKARYILAGQVQVCHNSGNGKERL